MDVRLKYAEFYDEFRNTDAVKLAQVAVWAKFVPFEEPGPLSLEDRRQLRSLIASARSLDATMATNWPVSQKLAEELGIKAELASEVPAAARDVEQFAICKPILSS